MKPRTSIPRLSKKKAAEQEGRRVYSTISGPRSPIAKVGKQKAKRQARNKAYYASAEWRAKRKAVFERDGFQCVETWQLTDPARPLGVIRCPNRGEIVNGKQTSRGLVCEEVSYGHRGNASYIDTCKTRCKDCDRRCTPLERANHAHGFSGRAHVGESA